MSSVQEHVCEDSARPTFQKWNGKICTEWKYLKVERIEEGEVAKRKRRKQSRGPFGRKKHEHLVMSGKGPNESRW